MQASLMEEKEEGRYNIPCTQKKGLVKLRGKVDKPPSKYTNFFKPL
jgi:hypothetical protein